MRTSAKPASEAEHEQVVIRDPMTIREELRQSLVEKLHGYKSQVTMLARIVEILEQQIQELSHTTEKKPS